MNGDTPIVAAKLRIEGSFSPAVSARVAILRRIASITALVRVLASFLIPDRHQVCGRDKPYSSAELYGIVAVATSPDRPTVERPVRSG